jgi:hypothetical protein
MERKASVLQQELTYRGYQTSSHGILPDSELVKKILNVKAPKKQKQNEKLNGIYEYYRRFVVKMADVAYRLYKRLKNKVKFTWKPERTSRGFYFA